MEMYLNILDKCHVSGLALSIDLIFEKFLLATNITTSTRIRRHLRTLQIRSATILSKKLNALKLISDADEIYDILSEPQYRRIQDYSNSYKSNEM